ncbi:MAG: permease-like cell division protein FtsX [Candidatus Falkowbacteria bacterium]
MTNNALSFQIFFEPAASQSEINGYIEEIKNMHEVADIQSKDQNETHNEFTARHQNNQRIQDSLNELDFNPLSSSVIIKTKHIIMEDYLKTKQEILDLANEKKLYIEAQQDINLVYKHNELNIVKKASIFKDLPFYIFNGGYNFFADNYSPICDK